MKALDFENFLLESTDNLPATVKLAKLGLSPGIPVLEWWTKVRPNASELLTVYWKESYTWPEESGDDMLVKSRFHIDSSLEFIEKRLMEFAESSGLEWVHDMERDTWKKV